MIAPEYPGMREREMQVGQGFERNKAGLFLPSTISPRQLYGPWPIAVDLFCGCGGLSLGFMQAGWRMVAAVENEPWAALTYMHNLGTYPIDIQYVEPGDKACLDKALRKQLKIEEKRGEPSPMFLSGHGWISRRQKQSDETGFPNAPEYFQQGNEQEIPGCPYFFFGDIRKLTGKRILDVLGLKQGDIDAVVGGPPCQGFSKANGRTRGPENPLNDLVFEFARLVLELMPKTMVMENVPEFVRMKTPEGDLVIERLMGILEDGGFSTRDALRDALGVFPDARSAKQRKHEAEEKQSSTKKGKRKPRPHAVMPRQTPLF